MNAAGRSVLLIAGEVSGDMHAAGVVRAVLRRDPSVRFFGIGGDQLRAAGVEILHDAREMAVLGLTEVLRRYGFFKRVFDEMVETAQCRRPDLVMLVDYPGFNLRFAARMHELGIPVFYYICPQVWAWHRSRIQLMARIVKRLAVIFPFEPAVFEGTGLKVDFVGHPLVDVAAAVRAEPVKALPWKSGLRVALLPGSRRQEIRRILPALAGAAVELEKKFPGVGYLVASPTEASAVRVREVLAGLTVTPSRLDVVVGDTRQVLRQARAGMIVSGTATVEAALMGCPMIVVYRTSWPTYFWGRMLIQVSNLGMVNIVAGRTLCPEFIQNDTEPRAMAAAMEPLLADTPERAAMVAGLDQVRKALGKGGAAERTAEVLLEELRCR